METAGAVELRPETPSAMLAPHQTHSLETAMRIVMPLIAALLLGACSSTEYRDTNAAVDANPLCVGLDRDAPANLGPKECERKTETVLFQSEPKDSKPIDFSGKKDD
jgi:hypothetical protein